MKIAEGTTKIIKNPESFLWFLNSFDLKDWKIDKVQLAKPIFIYTHTCVCVCMCVFIVFMAYEAS